MEFLWAFPPPVNAAISVPATEPFPVLLIPDVRLPHAQSEIQCNFIPIKGVKTLSGTHWWLHWRNVLVSSLSAAGKIGECDKHFILQALYTSVKLLSEEVCCTGRLWGVQRWLGCLSHSKHPLECFLHSGQPLQKFHCAKPWAPVTSRQDGKKRRQKQWFVRQSILMGTLVVKDIPVCFPGLTYAGFFFESLLISRIW